MTGLGKERNKSFQKVSLALGGTFLALLICEGVLRLFFNPPRLGDRWVLHPYLGYTFIPKLTWSRTEPDKATSFKLTTNSMGFRDVEHRYEKSSHVRRVVILGDSFMAGTDYQMDKILPSRLEAYLNSHKSVGSQESWEVISLSVGGWGTAQQLIAFEKYGIMYEPDVVVLMMSFNDMYNNSVEHVLGRSYWTNLYRPYFVSNGRGLRRKDLHPASSFLRRASRLFAFAETAYYNYLAEKMADADEVHKANRERLYLYAEPTTESFERMWAVTRKLIKKLKAESESSGAKFIATYIPYYKQLYEGLWEDLVRPVKRASPDRSWPNDAPDKRIKKIFEDLNVNHVLLYYHFKSCLPSCGELFLRDGHFTEKGHQLAAKIVGDKVEAIEIK